MQVEPMSRGLEEATSPDRVLAEIAATSEPDETVFASVRAYVSAYNLLAAGQDGNGSSAQGLVMSLQEEAPSDAPSVGLVMSLQEEAPTSITHGLVMSLQSDEAEVAKRSTPVVEELRRSA